MRFRSMVSTFATAVILVVMAGCADDLAKPATTEGEPAVTFPSGAVPGRDAAIGQTEVGDGFAMRLISVTAVVESPDLTRSPAGRHYLLIELELVRRGEKPAEYWRTNFAFWQADHDGRPMGVEVQLPADRAFGSGTLAQGQRRHGFIAISVADMDGDLLLTFRTRGVGGVHMTWWIADTPVTPPEAIGRYQCRVPPRDRTGVSSLTGGPRDGYPTSPPSKTVHEIKMTATRTVLRATAAVERAVACINAGDRDRLAALVTDDFLRRYPAVAAALLDPAASPLPARALTVVAVEDLHRPANSPRSADGYSETVWARATVTIADPARPGETVSAIFYFRYGGTPDLDWLIDDVHGDGWLIDAFSAGTPEA